MASHDGLLIDIDGVLVVSWEPIGGSVEAFTRLRASGLPFRLITNTTTRTRADIAASLRSVGYDVAAAEILTAPAATAAYLRSTHPGARCLLISAGDVVADLEGIDLVDAPEPAEVVVLGGAGSVYTYERLNHAYHLLLDGAAYVAMHRNLSWRTAGGIDLDSGAYALGLEAASGVSPVVLGKPSADFFRTALDAIGVAADRSLMIGDDVEADVLGAQGAGISGCLVRTGKYRADWVAAASGSPDLVVDDFAAAVDAVLAAGA